MNQRQGFLVSAIVHLVILMALASRTTVAPRLAKPAPESVREPVERVFLPPREVLRQLLSTRPKAPQPVPRPEDAPRPATKDRISVGPPSSEHAKGPLVLRKEDDLTAVPKGRPKPVPPAPPEAPAPDQTRRDGGAPEVKGTQGPPLPPGAGRSAESRGDQGSRARPGASGPSITDSLRNLERRLQDPGPAGLPSGTGQQMGPLFFDPEGADFTVWINHFKNEVYRNWIIPQPALLGFRGHVDIQFTVERDGTLTNLKTLKSSGTPALDRAAENALVGSRLLPLPADFGPPRVTMQVTFYYNDGPQGS